jgi:hypothetical protein
VLKEWQRNTSWPITIYLIALLFALLSMLAVTPTLGGSGVNRARALAQLTCCGVLALRLGYAIYLGERSRTWIGYIVAMFFAAPIWIALEMLLLPVAQSLLSS